MIDHDAFLRLMLDFLNEDLDLDRMEEFHRKMEEEFYRQFFNTYKKTVDLCRCCEMVDVPREVHITLIETLRRTPQALPPRPRKARKPRKPR